MNWDDLALETAERFGGTFPHPETRDAIATVHQRAPNAVERTIDQVAADYQRGDINSPWGILRSRVQKITADVTPKATASNQREKAIARAEQWLRTAGLHYDRPSEILDELFGDRGMLRTHRTPDLEQRIVNLWTELRPLGEQAEHDQLERLARYAEQRARMQPTNEKPRDETELKAIARAKAADTTRL